MEKERSLTPKQEKFVLEFMVDNNGAQAAIRAGYAKNSARVTASKLLTNANIQRRIQELQKKDEQELGVTRLKWLQDLNHIAQSSIIDVVDLETGEIKLVTEENEKLFNNISSVVIKPTEHGNMVTLRMYNRLEAHKTLGQALGYITGQEEFGGLTQGFFAETINFMMNYQSPK